jgi:O-antigen ligase
MLPLNKISAVQKNNELFSTIFMISIICIEVNFGINAFNIGNLIALLGSFIVICFFLKTRGVSYSAELFLMPDFIFAFLLGVFFAISTWWSISPNDTIVQSLYFFIILIGSYHLKDCDLKMVIRTLLIITFWVAILSIIALLISRNYALQPAQSTSFPELRGIFRHQQRLGLFMCLSLGIAVIAYLNNESEVFIGRILKYKKLYILFITLVTIFAFARLYMLFSVISLIICFLMTKYVFVRNVTVLSFIIILLYLYNIEAGAFFLQSYTNDDISLTGRVWIWKTTLEQAMMKPILGFGYGVFNSPLMDYMWKGNYRAPHAHNSLIQAFFDGGWIGLSLLIILIYQHFKKSTKIIFQNKKIQYSSYVFFQALICSFTGVTYAGKPSVLYSFLFLFLALTPYKKLKIVWK